MAVAAKKKSLRRQQVEEIIRAEDNWEPVGHTPMPELPDLRNWTEGCSRRSSRFMHLCAICVVSVPMVSVTLPRIGEAPVALIFLLSKAELWR